MIRVALQTCLTVLALLFSASVTMAAECGDDPKECTPKKLCEVATNLKGGNAVWSTASRSAKHVTYAQGLGMSCGVVAVVDLCDTDPNECKINQLCEKATKSNNGQIVWNSAAQGYVDVAKEFELTCDVETQKTSKAKFCNDDIVLCNNQVVCLNITHWRSNEERNGYINEAKRRQLNCSAYEGENAGGILHHVAAGLSGCR